MDEASQPEPRPGPARPPCLRLVWSRPADAPPPPPRRRTNLAVAIDRHISGEDGLTDQEFVRIFACGREDRSPPLRTVSN